MSSTPRTAGVIGLGAVGRPVPGHRDDASAGTGLRSGVVEAAGENGPVDVLRPRDVPLGGPRGMTVRRTLPQRTRSLIGAWCFLDAYGPDDVAATGGMTVARHPHTGLATVSWLFEGRINHVDSAGHWATVRPGDVDLMNAGRGITHSEFSTRDTTVLHGVQLWYAFPEDTRFGEPSLDTHRPEPVCGEGFTARVFIGSLLGVHSPVVTRIPLTGAEIRMEPHTRLDLTVPAEHEHGVLRVTGSVAVDGVPVPADSLAFTPTGRTTLRLTTQDDATTVLLLGGEPLNEQIVMWWNFVGRSHEEIETWRRSYMEEMGCVEPGPDSPRQQRGAERSAQRTHGPVGEPVGGAELDELAGATYADGRPFPQFGTFPPDQPAPLPAPELPRTILRPRG